MHNNDLVASFNPFTAKQFLFRSTIRTAVNGTAATLIDSI